MGAHRPDGGEVVADAAAAAHGFGGLQQGGVDAGPAVDDFGDRIADRLHEAVDQRRAQIGAGGGIDAAGGHEAVFLGFEKALLPEGALVFGFDCGQRARDAIAHIMHAALVALGVLFQQYLARYFLRQGQTHLLDWNNVSGDRRVCGHIFCPIRCGERVRRAVRNGAEATGRQGYSCLFQLGSVIFLPLIKTMAYVIF